MPKLPKNCISLLCNKSIWAFKRLYSVNKVSRHHCHSTTACSSKVEGDVQPTVKHVLNFTMHALHNLLGFLITTKAHFAHTAKYSEQRVIGKSKEFKYFVLSSALRLPPEKRQMAEPASPPKCPPPPPPARSSSMSPTTSSMTPSASRCPPPPPPLPAPTFKTESEANDPDPDPGIPTPDYDSSPRSSPLSSRRTASDERPSARLPCHFTQKNLFTKEVGNLKHAFNLGHSPYLFPFFHNVR